MRRTLGIVTLLVVSLAVCGAPPVIKQTPPVKLSAPELHKVRWQTFDKKVRYAVIDARGRTWFMRKDQDDKHAQFICADVPGAHLMLPNNYRTLRVDRANRLWMISKGEIWCFDLNTHRRVVKKIPGLFAADTTTGWPGYRHGQIYLSHSSKRVYCHDFTGIHVFDGKVWAFNKWPADLLVGSGKVDLKSAQLQAVEAPGGLAVFWSRAGSLNGFWTHDGRLWRHYSSKSDRRLRDITAIVPISQRFVLVCSASKDAFVVDISSGAALAMPDTTAIVRQLIRLGDKDPKISAAAKSAVHKMVRINAKKVTEAAEFLSDPKLRKLAMSVIRNTPGEETKRSKTPPGPGRPLRNARLIVRNLRGDALLTWAKGDQDKMGVLTAGGKIVETPGNMSLEMHRHPDQCRITTPDGSIIMVTQRLWKWDGREFKLLSNESLECVQIELLGSDKSGRIFMEVEGPNEWVRAVFDARYKGVEGSGVFDHTADIPPPSPRV